jgi:hypothetical protein
VHLAASAGNTVLVEESSSGTVCLAVDENRTESTYWPPLKTSTLVGAVEGDDGVVAGDGNGVVAAGDGKCVVIAGKCDDVVVVVGVTTGGAAASACLTVSGEGVVCAGVDEGCGISELKGSVVDGVPWGPPSWSSSTQSSFGDGLGCADWAQALGTESAA